ncbi:MAG: aminomethyl-transferring glycine dehydrogenase subunit GcvPA, partial [Spirochaetia bacterium]|nr:aminomethyl-transferring glycine dehydrogenase subunit GcvPA [Spirochaetia bacterium]
MKYLPLSPEEKSRKIKDLGLGGVDDLFRSIHAALRVQTSEKLDPPKSELEIRSFFDDAAPTAPIKHSFLGGKGHNHYIPSIITPIVSRGEFLTAYTPYQPEISQGTLQAMFEFQSMMANLMGVEVSNASVYDGSTSMMEACFMAMRITGRSHVLLCDHINDEYRETMETYAHTDLFTYASIPCLADGSIDTKAVGDLAGGDNVACVVVQSPDKFGILQNIAAVKKAIGDRPVMLVALFTEAMSLALVKSPGSQGADIVCGEAQSFGVPLSFGGPWLGVLGTSMKNVRNMPGRLIGEAKDADGKRCFVITLAAREQHIRREKATSNICTNQGLMALRASVYLATMGKQGLRRAAERCSRFTARAKATIGRHSELHLAFPDAPVFNELAINLP